MKIAIIGYGKMGKMVSEIAQKRGHEIVCIVDVDNQDAFFSTEFASADVAIEFTTPQTAFINCQKAWSAGVKVVSGTTGWTDAHSEEIRVACTSGGRTLFWASNFSVGVAIFSAVNKHLAHIMNAFPQYDVSETETHHIHKLDHPSGTAVTLANQIIGELERKTSWQEGAMENKEVLSITSIRQGEVNGIHSISYDSPEDSITITHDAHSRRGFALGAVLAAEYTLSHDGLLGISDMFQF